MEKKKIYNINDWVLLGTGILGLVIVIYGLKFDNKSCNVDVAGFHSTDTVIVGILLFVLGIGYKHIAKYFSNKGK